MRNSTLALDQISDECPIISNCQSINFNVDNNQLDTSWGHNEFETVDLGDRRLNVRLMKFANHMIESPECSINQACGNWPEAKAAYRFFKNDSVSADKILSSHVENTVQRAKQYNTILAIQDTSYISYMGHDKTTGLCKLTNNRGKVECNGLIMHTTLATTVEGLPLGMLDQKVYSRESLPEEIKELKKQSHGNAVSIEQKESIRWLISLQESNKYFKPENTQVVTVCDREGDMYDLFELAHRIEAPVLIRASQDRTVNKTTKYTKKTDQRLWTVAKKFPCQGTIQVKVPPTNNKPSRIAALEVCFGTFTMNLPRNNFKNRKENLSKADTITDLKLTAVYVVEKNPPSKEDALEWMLLTNLPVNNFDQAVEKVRWYCIRWKIEVFHKVLKSGFKVEECRLSTAQRLIRYLTVMSVIACRIFFMTVLSRTNPNLPCTSLLSEAEWKVLYAKTHKTRSYPATPPTVNEVVKWIAQLGGFLGRKNDGNPGTMTLWRGWRRFSDLVEGWHLAVQE